MSESSKTLSSRRRSRSRSKSRDNKPIRVWCPGSYDFLHYGRTNFLRKVKEEMSLRFPKIHIVAGLYSDEDMIAKGRRPVFSISERFDMVRSIKWVDDIVKGAPLELSKDVLKAYACDYAFYLEEDENFLKKDNLWKEVVECGLLKTVSNLAKHRDVSTSDMIYRLLRLEPRDVNNNTKSGKNWNEPAKFTFPDSISCKEMLRFVTGNTPKRTDKIVYVNGSFDVLHPGHLNLLEKAQNLGDFLYVGLHSDESISKYAGKGFPVMQWNERAMALLSCKYVSEIIIDAPVDITSDLLDAFSVTYVVPAIDDYKRPAVDSMDEDIDRRFDVAKLRDVFQEISVGKDNKAASVTTLAILDRIHENWSTYCYSSRASKVSDVNNAEKTDVCESKIIQEKLENVNLANYCDDGGERVSALEANCGGGNAIKFRYEL